MLKQLIEQNWEKIKENIKFDNGITDIAYNIWIYPLAFNDCDDNVLTILIPASNKDVNPEIQLDYIKKHYTKCFPDALFSLFGKKMEVEFILASLGIQEEKKAATIPVNNENVSSSLNPKDFLNFIFSSFEKCKSNRLQSTPTPGI